MISEEQCWKAHSATCSCSCVDVMSADQVGRLFRQAIMHAEDSIEFLKKTLEVASSAVIVERRDAQGHLDRA